MSAHKGLAAELRELRPDLHVSEDVLPSGVVWIDVQLDGSTLVIECGTDGTFGMSVRLHGAADFGGHDAEYKSREELLAAVWVTLI